MLVSILGGRSSVRDYTYMTLSPTWSTFHYIESLFNIYLESKVNGWVLLANLLHLLQQLAEQLELLLVCDRSSIKRYALT